MESIVHPTSRTVWVLSLIGAAALGVLGVWLLRPAPAPPQAPVLALEKMGHLVSLRVNYADVIEFTEKRTLDIPWSQWEVPLGGTRVLLIARGDCTVATDLRSATYEAVDEVNRSLTVVLPAPQTLQARVNHEPDHATGSYFYAISNQGIEGLIPDTSNRTRAIDNALSLAQRQVALACANQEVLASAKGNAEDLLRATFQAIGWTPSFTWR